MENINGFDLSIDEKKTIFDNIVSNMNKRSVLNLNTLLVLCEIDEIKFREIFDDKLKLLVTNQLAKNNVTMKIHCLEFYYNDDTVNSKKELMKLATFDDEFSRISNQWVVKEVIEDFILEAPEHGDEIYESKS